MKTLPLKQAGEVLELMRRRSTWDERTRFRLGPDYEAIEIIRKETPAQAVILFSDRFAPSPLDPFKAKHQDWATCFLYPRKILYLNQRGSKYFEQAKWLLVDGPASVSWIAPEFNISHRPGHFSVVPFDMAAYLEEVRQGRISSRYLPGDRPDRPDPLDRPNRPDRPDRPTDPEPTRGEE